MALPQTLLYSYPSILNIADTHPPPVVPLSPQALTPPSFCSTQDELDTDQGDLTYQGTQQDPTLQLHSMLVLVVFQLVLVLLLVLALSFLHALLSLVLWFVLALSFLHVLSSLGLLFVLFVLVLSFLLGCLSSHLYWTH